MHSLTLLLGYTALLVVAVQSSIIQCDPKTRSCTLNNYQGLWTDRQACTVSSVAYPASEAELIAAVASAVQRNQSIKVVSGLAHSYPKLACPRGKSGLLISTVNYDQTILVNKASRTVTADAGVQLGDLVSKLAENGLTLPVSPAFDGISIAGAICTGAHGSGLRGRGGAMHEYVVGMRLVVPASRQQGYAKVVELTSADPDLNAAKVSLGVLGAISRVTFEVQPMFKRSVVKVEKTESHLEEELVNLAHDSDFGEIIWNVNQGRVIYTQTSKVPVSTPGEGRLINFPPVSGALIKSWRVAVEREMESENRAAICKEALMNSVPNEPPNSFVNENNTFKGYPVVGFNNLMQMGGGCQKSSFTPQGDKLTCGWDANITGQVSFESEISVPLSRIEGAIRDIKMLRDVKNLDKFCVLNIYGGNILRFVRGSTAYLASPEDSVYFDMKFFRNRDSNGPTMDKDGIEEIQQILLKKHHGRPHWGKGQDFEFEGVRRKVTNLPKFIEVKRRMDPDGLFSSDWSDAVLGIGKKGARGVSTVQDGCGLEGLCICSKNSHCAPDQGYLCQRGLVYKSAMVCRKTSGDILLPSKMPRANQSMV